MTADQRSPLGLLNPLPNALLHYSGEVEDVLTAEGYRTQTLPVQSAEIGKSSFVAKGIAAQRHLRALRGLKAPFIEFWPVVGHLELLGSRRVPRSAVVFHDPIPIRRQIGYDRRSIALGVRASRRSAMLPVAHSHAAEETLRELGYANVTLVPHPMVSPRFGGRAETATVRVLGQYKPARDLDLLARLGGLLRRGGYSAEIVGRGWPAVDGWNVRDEFVSESELDTLLATSAVVLIPYQRYWQSGVAIRALEVGTPVVGAANGFLSEIYGSESPALVRPHASAEEWLEAVSTTSTLSGDDMSRIAEENYRSARRGWADLAAQLVG